MPSHLKSWLFTVLVVGIALIIRTRDLDRRPMHADEANQALKAGQLLEGEGYAFDPADHHGPTLYYAVLPIAWIRGERSLTELTETTVRLVPALAGTLAVLLLCRLARPLGELNAVAAGALLAASPPAAYYSRFFIQETLLQAAFLGGLLCALHWWRTGRLGWALGAGTCAGLMQATKASAPLFVLAALVGVAIARAPRPASSRLWRDLGLAGLAALVVAGLFYSSFGTNLRGLADALSTYATALSRLSSGLTGHEKPAWYYLSLFGWQRGDGVTTHQVAFSLLAIVGLLVAIFSRPSPLLRWTAGSTVGLFLIFSLSAYKTPWHAIHFVPGMAILAAGAFTALEPRRYVSWLVAALVGITSGQQIRLTSFQRPADERNPYAYVHASSDVLKVRSIAATAPNGAIRVISEEVWPLPWYLRGLPDVGYWNSVPADCDGALVLASAGLAEQVQARLHGTYTTGYIGLRPGFTLVVFKRQP